MSEHVMPRLMQNLAGIHREDTRAAADAMIANTFFLAKIIHRIGAQNIRGKKCLHESLVEYWAFLAIRAGLRTRGGGGLTGRTAGSRRRARGGGLAAAGSRTGRQAGSRAGGLAAPGWRGS
jgi:hypothetical protein